MNRILRGAEATWTNQYRVMSAYAFAKDTDMQSNPPPILNLSDPTGVVKEIFDDDKWVKDGFTKHFSVELLAFGETLAESFKRYPKLDAMAKGEDEQALYVFAFIHAVFDDLITSTKLLVTGKMVPSGNLVRQALEGMVMAVLCSSRKMVLIPTNSGKNSVPVKYWELVKASDRRVESHKAIGHLELNRTQFSVSKYAIDELRRGITKYHQFSHPSIATLVARVRQTENGITPFIGGVFNEAMMPMYKFEIEQRTNLSRILPNLIDLVITHLNAPR